MKYNKNISDMILKTISIDAKYFVLVLVLLSVLACKNVIPSDPSNPDPDIKDPELNISLKAVINKVQPMTGMVFWSSSSNKNSDVIQLEYSYMLYSDIVNKKDQYNWEKVDNLLNGTKNRNHQAILRFRFTYPGEKTSVPEYIKQSPGYKETKAMSEGLVTWFPDWSFKELKDFTLQFYSKFAARYDSDERIAFLQVGFGLWAEYHIYDGPMILGKTFPSKMFQKQFFENMEDLFNELHWSVSIDSADGTVSPLNDYKNLLKIDFGLFDDSFLHKNHHGYNANCFTFLGLNRYFNSPIGGELSYYTTYDQKHALDKNGPHGISFEDLAEKYHVSYMIGEDQPLYQTMERIESAGISLGYKFKILSFKASSKLSRVTVKNVGIAPLYYDTFVAVNGSISDATLKGLLPGEELECVINAGGKNPKLTIECKRLPEGQYIQFEADI